MAKATRKIPRRFVLWNPCLNQSNILISINSSSLIHLSDFHVRLTPCLNRTRFGKLRLGFNFGGDCLVVALFCLIKPLRIED